MGPLAGTDLARLFLNLQGTGKGPELTGPWHFLAFPVTYPRRGFFGYRPHSEKL